MHLTSLDEAIRCFQACQWDSCLRLFAERIRLEPADQAAKRYQQAAERFRRAAPPPNWNGAIDASDV
jgi:hypothetical protein